MRGCICSACADMTYDVVVVFVHNVRVVVEVFAAAAVGAVADAASADSVFAADAFLILAIHAHAQ